MDDPAKPTAPLDRRITAFPLTRQARLRAAALLCAITGGLALVAAKDPRSYGMGVLCPTRRLLGIYCPGCGTTRAANDLLHGNLDSALANNPLAVFLGVPLLLLLMANLWFGAVRGVAWRLRMPRFIGPFAVSVLVLYGVARNIPLESLDFLRPPKYRLLPEAAGPPNHQRLWETIIPIK